MLTYKRKDGTEIQLKSAEGLKGKIAEISHNLNAARVKPQGGKDITLREYLAETFQTSPEHLYHALGIDPNVATVDFLLTVDTDTRWIVPEIFRDAIRLGFVQAPIYPALVASTESIAQPTLQMPSTNMSDAEPSDMGEAQTIAEGTVSYQSKSVKIKKQGIGLKISYEAIQYSSINLVSMFFQDMGTKLGRKLDNEAITILVSGDQADGSQSCANVGVASSSDKIKYKDIVKMFVRLSLLSRQSKALVGREAMINTLLNLSEFKDKTNVGGPLLGLNLRSPLPTQQDIFVNNTVASDKLLFVDTDRALVQLTSAPLLVESEKIINRQLNNTVATITTGFANIFRDARCLLDGGTAEGADGAAGGFPTWMSSY